MLQPDDRADCLHANPVCLAGARVEKLIYELGPSASRRVPEVQRLLGVQGGYGEEPGLSRDWAARIIRHVGNYAEVYDRNVGADSPLGIPRGLNQLRNAGGILYAPPIQ